VTQKYIPAFNSVDLQIIFLSRDTVPLREKGRSKGMRSHTGKVSEEKCKSRTVGVPYHTYSTIVGFQGESRYKLDLPPAVSGGRGAP